MAKIYSKVIHWFRRDLRLRDNTALLAAVQAGAEVVTVYVMSDWKRHHAWTGPARQGFLAGCLAALEQDVAAAGGRLIFRQGKAVEQLERLIAETGAEAVFYNKDPDPHGQQTEAALERLGQELGVAVRGFQDVVLHGRSEVLTAADKPYRVFTPYRRNWESLPKPPVGPAVTRLTAPAAALRSEPCPTLASWALQDVGVSLPEAGRRRRAGA